MAPDVADNHASGPDIGLWHIQPRQSEWRTADQRTEWLAGLFGGAHSCRCRDHILERHHHRQRGPVDMELTYTSADETTIQATLDEGEQLGNHTGPAVIFVPTDPGNAEYADIVANKYPIAPYVP